MSWVGMTRGAPLAGERTLFDDSMRTVASSCARGQRDVDGHLVAVEVRDERGADQRMDLDGLALTRMGSKPGCPTVERRRPVQEQGLLLDERDCWQPMRGLASSDQAQEMVEKTTGWSGHPGGRIIRAPVLQLNRGSPTLHRLAFQAFEAPSSSRARPRDPSARSAPAFNATSTATRCRPRPAVQRGAARGDRPHAVVEQLLSRPTGRPSSSRPRHGARDLLT